MAAPEYKLSSRIVDAANALRLDATKIGGKAFNLARLTEQGLSVPPWFCVTTDVFNDTLNDLASSILKTLPPIPDGVTPDRAAIRTVSQRIMEQVGAIRLPDADTAELYRHFDTLFTADAVVAVRSSAVGEDSSKDSFAGQMDTYLCVRRESLVNRVIACLASAFSERALLYRSLRHDELASIKSAVIVQAMIEPRAAGVTFTANPTTGDPTEIVIAAAFGLGEGVVAGLVETDTYFLDAESGAVRERIVTEKHSQIVFDNASGKGTQTIPVAPEQARVSVLNDGQLASLVAMCRQVRDFYQSPQDIEWAIDSENKIHLLQSRPITTLTRERQTIFDNSNIVESYPGISSPLTFSYARNGYAATFRESLRLLGVPTRILAKDISIHQNLVGLLNGRIYYNLLNWYRLFEVGGFEWMLPAWEKALALPRRYVRSRPLTLEQRLAGLRVKLCFVWHFFRVDQEIASFDRLFRKLYSDFRQRDLSKLEAHDLLELHELLASSIRGPYGISVINDALTQQLHSLLGTLISSFELGDSTSLRNALLCGETGMESVEPVRSGLQLAEHIRSDASLLALFKGADPAPTVWRSLYTDTRFAAFRDKLAGHLEAYGDRTLDELKLETPSAEDNPEFVIGILRNYLRGGQDVESMERREVEIRTTAEQNLDRKLRGRPLHRWIVRLVLSRVRRGMKNRENLRLTRTRAFGMSKRIYRALGNRFVEKRLIDAASDVFFLSEEEIAGAVRGHALTQDLRQLILLRKREYGRFKEMSAGGRIVTHGMVRAAPLNDVVPAASHSDQVLKGQGCSPGRVKGKARVIRDPASDLDLDGEILVAPMTDPGWVFLMVASKGLISEKGSLLSHTAIIGRELGIPTIVGVRDATRRIASGQLIEIDGDAGTVTLL